MNKQSAWMIVFGVACVAAGVAAGSRKPAVSSGTSAAAAPAATRGQSPDLLVIRDVRVFDGERVVERANVTVRNGRIVSVGAGAEAPAGATSIDGTGHTLLPGFIDAHTHAFGDALERALVFGVTTELDMFTSHEAAAGWRRQQRAPEGAPNRADILSAGTLVTAPGGHGTEYGVPIPTISSAADAPAFVDARIAEGSDYIKIVYDDGAPYGMKIPTLSNEVLRAVIAASKARGKLALVHVGSRRAAEEAIEAGASGLVHLFGDEAPTADFGPRVRAAEAFVIPTLSVIGSVSGTAGAAGLASGSPLTPFLTQQERAALSGSFPKRAGATTRLEHAISAVRRLHEAGVPLLAGSDAPNPGTAHGATIHRELELLARAGLSPSAALNAATATPARAFGLSDRGRIAPGMRADLLLVKGDPTRDITATREIVAVWKHGVRLDRRPAAAVTVATPPQTNGTISDFDANGTEPTAAFGSGWQVSTDTLMGGTSKATMRLVRPGARDTAGALEVTGSLAGSAPFPWAGAMFFPAAAPMSPADLSKFKEIVFLARGDGREYQVMVFATRLGNIPATRAFTAEREWKEYVMPFPSFSGIDGSDLRGILFSASGAPGPFRVVIDGVRLR